MQATVKREMHSFLGKPRKAGDVIADEEIAKVSPQTLKALINNGQIEIEGMTPGEGANAGTLQHIRARQDAHDDRLKKAEASNVELRARLEALEAKMGDGGDAVTAKTTKSKREARKAQG
jgi:hypothetical protein